MDLSGINLPELLVAAIAAMLIGVLWYGNALFGKRWQALTGMTEDEAQKTPKPTVFLLAFVLHFIVALFLSLFTEIAMMLGSNALYAGLMAALLCLAFVATTMGVNYLFSRKSFQLYAIDMGYMLSSFFVMGLIIGAWY